MGKNNCNLVTEYLVNIYATLMIFNELRIRSLDDISAGNIPVRLSLQSLITYRIMKDEDFPYTRSFEFAQDPGTARMLMLTLFIGAFIGVHFIFRMFDYGIYIYMVVLLVAVVVGWRKTFPENLKEDEMKESSKADAGV